MKSMFVKMICRILMISMVMLPFQTVYAGMITTDKVAASAAAQADRDAVLNMISRSEVSQELQARGIDPQAAASRVNAMTDQEVHTLAGKLDSAPAGAKNSGWAWAAVIIIAIVIWYNWK
jgi:uncharacterized membrane protein